MNSTSQEILFKIMKNENQLDPSIGQGRDQNQIRSVEDLSFYSLIFLLGLVLVTLVWSCLV